MIAVSAFCPLTSSRPPRERWLHGSTRDGEIRLARAPVRSRRGRGEGSYIPREAPPTEGRGPPPRPLDPQPSPLEGGGWSSLDTAAEIRRASAGTSLAAVSDLRLNRSSSDLGAHCMTAGKARLGARAAARPFARRRLHPPLLGVGGRGSRGPGGRGCKSRPQAPWKMDEPEVRELDQVHETKRTHAADRRLRLRTCVSRRLRGVEGRTLPSDGGASRRDVSALPPAT